VGEGPARRRRAQGPKADRLQAELVRLDPELARWADDFVFGEVWAREGLSFEERMLVAISQLAATGRTPQLRNYLFGAIQAGIDPRKIQEALVMLAVYTGFPNAIAALAAWAEVRESAGRRGLAGSGGKPPE
jgi:4-carboxymuconolactone decarboxylase